MSGKIPRRLSVGVLVSTFNRPRITEDAIGRLLDAVPSDWSLSLYVVDASTNADTAIALAGLNIEVISAPSDLFWAASMSIAERAAVRDSCDLLMWFNDDVLLDVDALKRMGEVWHRIGDPSDALLIGSMKDGAGRVSYGGLRTGRRVTRWTLVEPDLIDCTEVDMAHGNLVLTSRALVERIGGIDPVFGHGYADFDFSLRVRAARGRVVLAPGFFGTCERNPEIGTYRDKSLSRRQRWQLIRSPKGLPPRAHARYLRRHAGMLWPLIWVKPYLQVWTGGR